MSKKSTQIKEILLLNARRSQVFFKSCRTVRIGRYIRFILVDILDRRSLTQRSDSSLLLRATKGMKALRDGISYSPSERFFLSLTRKTFTKEALQLSGCGPSRM
jgi:hypothetical protein